MAVLSDDPLPSAESNSGCVASRTQSLLHLHAPALARSPRNNLAVQRKLSDIDSSRIRLGFIFS